MARAEKRTRIKMVEISKNVPDGVVLELADHLRGIVCARVVDDHDLRVGRL